VLHDGSEERLIKPERRGGETRRNRVHLRQSPLSP
jgi:hypothetical protein